MGWHGSELQARDRDPLTLEVRRDRYEALHILAEGDYPNIDRRRRLLDSISGPE
jgi:hypothetical protein